MTKKHDKLKAIQRATRDKFPDALGLRVHRSLSWLNKAEQSGDDADAQFLFLWISFNAAYSNELSLGSFRSEKASFHGFMKKLCSLDSDRRLSNLVWEQYSGGIRLLLQNKFVFQPFWDSQNEPETSPDWEGLFVQHQQRANKALAGQDTAGVLMAAFSSLYTLRNQLMHGGATWQSGVNREQVQLGVQILSTFVPVMIELMMDNHDTLWGDACYPVVS